MRSDQESRDHEEHVDSDEAAGQIVPPEVVQHNNTYGDGAQALDVHAESPGLRVLRDWYGQVLVRRHFWMDPLPAGLAARGHPESTGVALMQCVQIEG